MRAVTSGIAGELPRSGAFPGYLVEITVASGGVIRNTTLDRDFDFDGFTWATADLTVPDMSFDGTIAKGGTIEYGDMTIAVWIGNLYREFDEAPVRIWHIYADAPGEAEPFFIGKCGKIIRKTDKRGGESASIAIDADATALYSPRKRIQDVVAQKWLVRAGTLFTINEQPWRIDRPLTSNA
jgi:hypothetical protein